MKSRYILFFLICTNLIACHETLVDFSYSPTEPRAGEVVMFSNQASSGEDWEWTFGDGSTSTTKSPTHVYKRPGTYVVTLKVDDKSSQTKTHNITVYDTVPNFICSDTVGIDIFEDITFTALVYNPYNYTLSYKWKIKNEGLYSQLSATNTAETYQVFFNQAADNVVVELQIILNGDTTIVEHVYSVNDVPTTSVLMRNTESDYRQRIYGTRHERVQSLSYAEGKALLDQVQDTLQVFNDSTFTIHSLRTIFPDIEGFQIAKRKIYYRAHGLYVADINGTNRVQIESQPTKALCVDLVNNRIYWSVKDSVRYMPLVGSENNHFTTIPSTLNTLTNVQKITIDTILR